MSQYSALIAEQMGFPKDYCEKIRLASPMHDIGKLGVPDAVLQKPGNLSQEEWAEIKKHPIYGAEILKSPNNELMNIAHNIALTHHERYDGTGYPQGLKGEDIPIEGRIVAVADVFDALTSKRSYKDKFSLYQTLEMIRNEKGTHFDPNVVQAFEAALPKVIEILEQYPETQN
jgi:putative two-component system response regulator